MPHSNMTLSELLREAQDSKDSLVAALSCTLEEIIEEIECLENSSKEQDGNKRSSFEEQFEYIKKFIGLPNNY